MINDTVTLERLRELLHYDPETGAFTWLVRPNNRVKAGATAGCTCGNGYRIIRIDGSPRKAHRLAWLYVNGVWPADLIDNRNGRRSDNWIDNLRDSSPASNSQNQLKARPGSISGFLGVGWHKGAQKFQATIKVGKVAKYLGLFTTPEAAHAAYVQAKRQMHPGGLL